MSVSQPLDMFWFLPTAGDGPYLGSQQGARPAEFGYCGCNIKYAPYTS